MNNNILSSFKSKTISCFAIIMMSCFLFACASDVDSKKQQTAFYVDSSGNLLNKKGDLVKKAGEFKLDKGFYVDNNGERIQRNIDKTKAKINEKVSNTKDKLNKAVEDSKEMANNVANKTSGSVKESFNDLFNTKAVGTAYTLSDITFDPKSHRITKMSKEDVEGLAASLKEHPESRIQVQVHTADGKTKAECKQMANLRAEVVKDMLVALGVKDEQISAKGLGLTAEDAAKAVANKVEVIVEK